ncbi:oligo alginate lyase [Duganella rhizosphaerae]|uniref:heparinase II/III domain-containing protein n=1 Tax=Duganella rhizosphaerae TaxID=2885763 RepID=UPI0030E7D74B
MTFTIARIARLAVLISASVAWGTCHADWAQSTDPLATRPLPANLEVQAQNPPAFSWSRHPTNPASYVLEVTGPTAANVSTLTVPKNWYLPSKAMTVGTYSWRVRPALTQEWSTPRSFVLNGTSTVFEVPDSSVLRATILSRPRPRALPSGIPVRSLWPAGMVTERGGALTRLMADVQRVTLSEPPVKDSMWPLVTTKVVTADVNAQWASIRTHVNIVRRQVEAASLVYRLTGDPVYLKEALLRGDQLAALSPSGPTSYAQFDIITLPIAGSLLKAADFLAADLDATRRAAWMKSVAQRGADVYADLSSRNGWLDQTPFDEHGGSNFGYLAMVATLALGDVPAAVDWFDFSFRNYVNYIYHWSGPEGGYANGTAYGQYAIDAALQVWQPMSTASGLNIFDKPWAKGFLQFFMHFTPPGTPSHTFGDGNEDVPDLRYMKALASRMKSPQAAWYYKNITGDEDPLTQLQLAYPMPVLAVSTATPPPNSGLYPSIGWAAIHSDIADRGRTSLYFKSSPYGSFNHSHGDQNGFTLNRGGRKLLIGTGWYDWYNSPMWTDWYRATKSKNAVTFDGGQGQRTEGYSDPMVRNGKVVGFSSSTTMDFVEGDATPAFAGALTKARRQIWYLRSQDAFVVYDKLASATARTFEWNLHAPVPMVVDAVTGEAKIVNVDQSVCVTPIPNSADQKYKAIVGPAPKPGTTEYHGAYVKTAALTSAEFIMLLDVGCKHPVVSLTSTGGTRVLKVGAQSITLQP